MLLLISGTTLISKDYKMCVSAVDSDAIKPHGSV